MNKSIFILLSLIFFCCKEKTKENSNIISQNTKKHILTETKNGFYYEYQLDSVTNRKNGPFKCYFLLSGRKTIASKGYYKDGTLFGSLLHYIPDSILITKYENISFDKMSMNYRANAFVYDTLGNLKENKIVYTQDELDFSPIMKSLNCCFEIK